MTDTNFVPRKTTWGMILMTVAYLLELINTVIGLAWVGSQRTHKHPTDEHSRRMSQAVDDRVI